MLDVATVLASHDARALHDVKCYELHHGRWRHAETAPSFWLFCARERWYRAWCLGWVLRYEQPVDQAVAVVLLIRLATQLRFLKSYLGAKSIVSALTLPCMTALRRMHALIPEDYQARLTLLSQQLLDADACEAEVRQRSLPTIPLPSDVTAALERADALPTHVPSPANAAREWCNVGKLRALWREMEAFGRMRKAALACAYEAKPQVAEAVRRASVLFMEESEAVQVALKMAEL